MNDVDEQKPNTLLIDDREVDIRPGETIFNAARRLGIKLPHLCYTPKPGYRPDGNCRVCMVEIEGERVLAASCIRKPTAGMKVKTQTDRPKTGRRMVAELLLADQPALDFADDPESELCRIAKRQDLRAGGVMPATVVDANNVRTGFPDRPVDSVCPYCGVGCQLTYHIKDDKLLYVNGKDGPANQNRLCVKGRFGFDYVHNPQRLTQPMIRKEGIPKHAHDVIDPANPWTHFRPATWEEAPAYAADGLKIIRNQHGSKRLAGFGSAKGSNEEAYLFQKLVPTGFGTNNVDHCTRLCHASSVSALLEGVGSAAVTATFNECKNSEVIIVIGANPTDNHPVAATFIKNAAKAGVKLIVADPRRGDLARHATYNLQFNADTDVALLNAMLHTIVEEGLVNEAFVRDRTSGYEALAENVKKFSPEAMAPVCGIAAETIREVARLYATSRASIIMW